MRRFQRCKFARANTVSNFDALPVGKAGIQWEQGIAAISEGSYWGDSSIDYILDAQGEKIREDEIYQYHFMDGPTSYIKLEDY